MIAIFGALIPFLLGFTLFLLLGFSLVVSLVIGICMSITAEATKARVLLELRKLKTKVGSVMIGAGIFDDVIGLVLFILITYLLNEFHMQENLLLISSIFAFFIGILTSRFIKKNIVIKLLEKRLLYFLIPFFFISIGLHFNFNSLIVNFSILAMIIIIAILGKLIGVFMTKPFTKFKWKQLYLIGWGINSRGAIELALAFIAFRNNLIPIELYSSLVIMALVTTLIFPFIITHMIRKNLR